MASDKTTCFLTLGDATSAGSDPSVVVVQLVVVVVFSLVVVFDEDVLLAESKPEVLPPEYS